MVVAFCRHDVNSLYTQGPRPSPIRLRATSVHGGCLWKDNEASEGQPACGWCGHRRSSTEDAGLDGERKEKSERGIHPAALKWRWYFVGTMSKSCTYSHKLRATSVHGGCFEKDGEAGEGQPASGWCGHRRSSTEDAAPDEGEEDREGEKCILRAVDGGGLLLARCRKPVEGQRSERRSTSMRLVWPQTQLDRGRGA